MADCEFNSPEPNAQSEAAGPSAWSNGDRVLAPWEPTFLYAGTVEEIAEQWVLIRFDDGDAGWVDLPLIRPFAIHKAQQLMSRRQHGPVFYPGEIIEIDGENVHVDFGGGEVEQTTVSALRVPCQPSGRGTVPVIATSHIAYQGHLQKGDRVWALWQNSAYYPGTIGERRDREVYVLFDDGYRAWEQLEHAHPLELAVGMFVMGRWRMGGLFYPGWITAIENDRVHIHYEDGDEEWTTVAALALPIPAPQAGTTSSENTGLGLSARAVLLRVTTLGLSPIDFDDPRDIAKRPHISLARLGLLATIVIGVHFMLLHKGSLGALLIVGGPPTLAAVVISQPRNLVGLYLWVMAWSFLLLLGAGAIVAQIPFLFPNLHSVDGVEPTQDRMLTWYFMTYFLFIFVLFLLPWVANRLHGEKKGLVFFVLCTLGSIFFLMYVQLLFHCGFVPVIA